MSNPLSLQQHLLEVVESHYAHRDWPTGTYLCETLARKRPLAGLKILTATPIFRNTFTQYLALLHAGATVSVGLCPSIEADRDALALLQSQGVTVVHPGDAHPCDIVCDCGGVYASLSPRLGFVELTRSGVEKYTSCEKPVFLVDAGLIKRIETSLGTGESFFRAMASLDLPLAKGDTLVVYGTGKVGSGIILQALRRGLKVLAISDPNHVDTLLAGRPFTLIDYRDRVAVLAALRSAKALVTATGVAGAVETTCEAQAVLGLPIILANMGVEDEFGASFPAERVLEGKRPINFRLDEPTHLCYIDATMSLVTLGAIWVAEHPEAHGIQMPEASQEELLIHISQSHGRIADELTDLINHV